MIATKLSQVANAVEGRLENVRSDATVSSVSTDTRTLRPGELYWSIRGERYDGHDFVSEAIAHGAAACVVEKRFVQRCPSTFPLVVVGDSVAALGRLASAHRDLSKARVIAVTGSNGKTTTKNMLACTLKRSFEVASAAKSYNNAIGVPLTLLSVSEADEFVVVEIGTNAPGEIAALAAIVRPDAAVLTSVGRAHLAGFGDIDGVRAEKMSLFEHVQPGGLGVLPASEKLHVASLRADVNWVSIGVDDDADIRVTGLSSELRSTQGRIEESPRPGQYGGSWPLHLNVPGGHNALNAASAFAICRWAGMEAHDIVEGLAEFRLPQWRLEVRRHGDLVVINDCYNANPDSMAAAIDLLSQVSATRRVLVAGNMAELGDQSAELHREIGKRAHRGGIEIMVAVGGQADAMLSDWQGACHSFENAAEAAEALPDLLENGDVVLIKGSRAAGLEVIAPRIAERFEAAAGSAVGV
jgi:UDP-N-acetylmuramoyl-tripeptide--D-alanyl-D-alanine ligase